MYRWMPGSTYSIACSTIIGEQWFMAEFRHYRAFVEIAVRGSFTAGAQAPHVTHSTISEQIAGLEKGTGHPPIRSGQARGPPHQVRATAARIRPAIAPDGRFGCAGRDHHVESVPFGIHHRAEEIVPPQLCFRDEGGRGQTG